MAENGSSGDDLTVPVERWLRVIDDEYLADFIPSGGSAVKFVSGAEEPLTRLTNRLRSTAVSRRFLTAVLDPNVLAPDDKRPDFHSIDRFFFGVTAGIDWKKWAADEARRFLIDVQGLRLAEGRNTWDIEGIANDNGFDAGFLNRQYRDEIARRMGDRRLTYELRAALAALFRAHLAPESMTPTTEEVLIEWLSGRAVPGGAASLKKLQIFSRINYMNARHYLASVCRWLPQAGHSGLVAILDFRPYERRKEPAGKSQARVLQEVGGAIARGADSSAIQAILDRAFAPPVVTYSEQAYIRMLALLRRFIDEVDSFERLLLVVLTTPGYYRAHDSARTYFDYDALQTRIGNEVRDVSLANPVASLVHLGV